MIAEVHRDGVYYMQEYSIGKPKYDVKKVGKSDLRGTAITFQADPTIFPEIKYDWKTIVNRLRQQAYLVKALRVTVIDAREFDDKQMKKLEFKRPKHRRRPSSLKAGSVHLSPLRINISKRSTRIFSTSKSSMLRQTCILSKSPCSMSMIFLHASPHLQTTSTTPTKEHISRASKQHSRVRSTPTHVPTISSKKRMKHLRVKTCSKASRQLSLSRCLRFSSKDRQRASSAL